MVEVKPLKEAGKVGEPEGKLAVLNRVMRIPPRAIELLERAEKEMTLFLNVRVDDRTVITADAFVVYHNTARGPAKGGIRFAPNLTLSEVRDLAERMTWKTALTGIPFGGGKSGIAVDSKSLTPYAKREIMREFVHLIRNELTTGSYIPAPDLGTGPREMAVIYGEFHIPECVTGKPVAVGGVPGRREATGRGVATAARLAAQRMLRKEISECTVAIQGFGNVGSWTARFLSSMGAKVVAISDSKGGAFDEDGLDVEELSKHKVETGSVVGFAEEISNDELLSLDVDILIPAAVEEVLREENAGDVRAKLIVEGANGPTTPEGDEILRERGIPVIPDILANSGGVIASYIEWRSAKSGSITSASEVYATIDERINFAFGRMAELSEDKDVSYRDAAMAIAVGEVVRAMEERGWI